MADQSKSHDNSQQLQHQVEQAAADKTRLNITGSNSKAFLGVVNEAPLLDVSQHCGIISYEPTELVITARAGTSLREINATLAAHDQTLAFEPPLFGEQATIGGTIACALSGPAKPYLGGARDFVLGCKVLNGRGQIMQFGGEVMKNVAGYDVTRLMTGAMGTLGALLEVSVKVMPGAEQEITLASDTTIDKAIAEMQTLAGLGLPVTAAAAIDKTMYIRLSGTQAAITAASAKLPGDAIDTASMWQQLQEHDLPFFARQSEQSLWRISVPALTPEMSIDGNWLYDWAGMQRWLITEAGASEVRSASDAVGGHATLYRSDEAYKRANGVFHPLAPALQKLHQRLKHEFDPHSLFNYQRLFPEF